MSRIRSIKPEFWTDSSVDAVPAFWLYCITEFNCETSGPCKVGIATKLGTRVSSLQGGNWRQLVLIWKIRLSDRDRAKDTEGRLLRQFRPDLFGPPLISGLKSEWVTARPLDVLKQAIEFLDATHEPLRRVS